MDEEKKPYDLLSLFQRCGIENEEVKEKKEFNKPNIVYDEGFKTDDKVLNCIMKQFLNTKKHIQAVKKIDEGDYTKEYFEENLKHYNPKLHKVLEKCSYEKSHDDKLTLNKKEGDVVVSFK